MKKTIIKIIVLLVIIIGAIVLYMTNDAKTNNEIQQANVNAAPAVPSEAVTTDTNTNVNNSTNIKMENTTAQNGDMVFVHYTGKLTDGTKFDSSVDRGQPFGFVLGSGMVIAGWDKGILGMKIGEKKVLTIASADGYGAAGVKNPQTGETIIPPNATLVFDVELVDIKR